MCPDAPLCSATPDATGPGIPCERVPGVLILKLRALTVARQSAAAVPGSLGVDDVDHALTVHRARRVRALFPSRTDNFVTAKMSEMSTYYIARFSDDSNLDSLYDIFTQLPSVEQVEYDCFASAAMIPNDPYFGSQWGLEHVSGHDISAAGAWEIVSGSPDVVLANVDTGVLYDHEDLRDNIWVNPGEDLDSDRVVMDADDIDSVDSDGNGYVDDLVGWDFVEGITGAWPGEDADTQDNDPRDFNGHGTHTAGTMAAVTNNGLGVAGVAGGFGDGGCRIMCVRIGFSMAAIGNVEVPVTTMSIVAQAFYYAASNGATAINYSFLSGTGGGIEAAADFVTSSGSLLVVAAGNSANSAFGYLPWRSDVVTVAAVDSTGHRTWFTSHGAAVDLTAPGIAIWSTYSAHHVPEYRAYSGT